MAKTAQERLDAKAERAYYRKHKKQYRLKPSDIVFNIFNYAFFALFTLSCFFPFYYLFINTISSNDLVRAGKINFYPVGINFHNYVAMLQVNDLGNAFLVSVSRTLIGTFLMVLASALAGYLVTKKEMWHRKFWYRFLVVTMYFNAGIIPVYLNFLMLGLTDNYLVYILPVLKEALIKMKDEQGCDFGKHIIPYCHENKKRLFAYEFNGYWKDVGTLGSYWEANMELIDIIPEFNLYEEFWKIYTKSDILPPQYFSDTSKVFRSIIGEGTQVYGEVYNSVIGSGVTIDEGAIVRDSIIMQNVHVGAGAVIDKSIIAEGVEIGEGAVLGVGDEAPNALNSKVYAFGLVTIGENSYIPPRVQIGKNTAVSGITEPSDYDNGLLVSGGSIIKGGAVR